LDFPFAHSSSNGQYCVPNFFCDLGEFLSNQIKIKIKKPKNLG
jgi:hypothetical protein